MTSSVEALPRLPHTGRVTQGRLIVSEWTKLRTVRSTLWSMFVALILIMGIPSLGSAIRMHHLSPGDRAHFNPLDPVFAGVQIAQLAIGVLGVLAITGEYSTGMIRATMSAAPRRLPVLWAKAAVYATTVFVLTLPAAFVAFFGAQAILRPHHLSIAFGHAGVARAVVGAALYLTAIGLFALGLGAVARNTAGGIAIFAGIMFVIPPLLNVLPASWNHAASPYLPLEAGTRIFSIDSGTLSPWAGFGVLCGYAAAALIAAAVLLRRRDV